MNGCGDELTAILQLQCFRIYYTFSLHLNVQGLNENMGLVFDRKACANGCGDFFFSRRMIRRGGDDFLNTRCQCDAHAAGIAVNAPAHVGQQFGPFAEPQRAGLAAVMAKRNDADDAVNAAISGVISICAVVDVVFGGDGGVILGDIFLRVVVMVVNDANAAVHFAPVGFKDGNVVRIGFNGAALDENERVRMSSTVLSVDDAETFVGHGVGLAFVTSAATLF